MNIIKVFDYICFILIIFLHLILTYSYQKMPNFNNNSRSNKNDNDSDRDSADGRGFDVGCQQAYKKNTFKSLKKSIIETLVKRKQTKETVKIMKYATKKSSTKNKTPTIFEEDCSSSLEAPCQIVRCFLLSI